MKAKLKFIFAFILGGLVLGGLSIFAASTFDAEGIVYKNTTVKSALDNIYNNPALKKYCELKSANALVVGAKYECDPGDGVKRNFYVLAVNNNQVKLIMEHNITEGSSSTTMSWANAMTYVANNNLKSSWSNVLDIDLPLAQDIANAVGNTAWKYEDNNYNQWFYFDKNGSSFGQTQVAGSNTPSAYAWLFNYTRECTDYGCDSNTSFGEGEAYDYWTRNVVAKQSDTTGRAWAVHRSGRLHNDAITTTGSVGVRLVITISKDNIK